MRAAHKAASLAAVIGLLLAGFALGKSGLDRWAWEVAAAVAVVGFAMFALTARIALAEARGG